MGRAVGRGTGVAAAGKRPMAKAIDQATWGTLHMADGSDFTVYPGESGNYVDGVVRRYTSWSTKSINLDDVISITIGDTTIDLK